VLILFWKADYVLIYRLLKFVCDGYFLSRGELSQFGIKFAYITIIRIESSNFGPGIIYPDRVFVVFSVTPVKCQVSN
jgi:hypothetical protein